MGPPMAADSLRKALAIGADRAVLLTDRFFAGSDTLATTYALSHAIRKIDATFGPQDIVFAGKQTIDGDTAQVGPGVAKRLGLLQLTYVSKIADCDPEKRELTVERRSEGGVHVLKTSLPCLITMLEGSNEVRRGALEDSLRAARAEIITWSAKDAGIEDVTKCGLKGSPTIVKKVFAPAPRSERAAFVEPEKNAADSAEALIAAIFARHPALEADMTKLASGL
jgi:electron transfer flavoprotein beta subunit